MNFTTKLHIIFLVIVVLPTFNFSAMMQSSDNCSHCQKIQHENIELRNLLQTMVKSHRAELEDTARQNSILYAIQQQELQAVQMELEQAKNQNSKKNEPLVEDTAQENSTDEYLSIVLSPREQAVVARTQELVSTKQELAHTKSKLHVTRSALQNAINDLKNIKELNTHKELECCVLCVTISFFIGFIGGCVSATI